jgi:hypothetical protein
MGMFIIRILLTPLAVIDMWVNVVTAMVLWDKVGEGVIAKTCQRLTPTSKCS